MYKKIKIFSSSDNRGYFEKITDNNKKKFSQFFISYSKKKVFRGFHFYQKKNKSNRIIFLLKGEIIDYIVDLRKKNFGKLYKIKIKENSKYAYEIPWYFAHGFLALKNSTLCYFFERQHNNKYDLGINYNSILPELSNKKIIISKRDLEHPKIQDLKKSIEF